MSVDETNGEKTPRKTFSKRAQIVLKVAERSSKRWTKKSMLGGK